VIRFSWDTEKQEARSTGSAAETFPLVTATLNAAPASNEFSAPSRRGVSR